MRFPTNPIISSVSYLSVLESPPGQIFQYRLDVQKIGPFASPQVLKQVVEDAARSYISIYNASGKLDIAYEEDVALVRWRKLIYNASFNSVATVLRMDTPRMRMSRHVIDDLVRPIMLEIMAAAAACDVHLPVGFPEVVIRGDPVDTSFKPSMCQDVEKGNLMEIEYIVGEPLREGEARGVPMPVLRTIYGILKGLQLQIKESKGLWEAKFEADNPYQ
jgi:2-dehydropantoate 2-reductase